MLDTPAARNQVLDGLVAQHALLAEAARTHLSVSDERVRETILGIPGLTRPDGSFDKERYKALLSAQGLSELGFESQLRRDIAIQTLPEAAASSAFLPKTVVERTVKLQEQVREVRDLVLKPADFVGQVKVTDEALRKYYDENGAAFETPESAKVEYLVLSADAMASQVSLNADDVKTYYEQNKARYSAPEERKASHILVRLERGAKDAERKAATAKAEELLKQARGGADFAALAKANSQDPGSAANGGDLGYFTRDTMVKPFADAAFSMKEGELSGVVESEFGLHIIKLTGIKAGGGKPFEQVRAEIEAELRQQQATKRFTESAEQFTNTVYEQSDSLKPAAEKFKLAIQTADDVTRTGGEKLGPKSPLSNPKLLAALFTDETLKNKRNTEAIEVGGNTLVAARVVDYRPAQRKPFESVLAEVRARVVDAQARRMAVQAGEARLKELRAGAAPTGFSEPKPASRATAPVLPAPALEAVFKAPVDKLPAFVGVDLGPQGYGLYQVTRVVDPTAELVAQRQPAYQQQLAQLVGQQDTSDYLESLKARSKVKKFPERLSAKSETR
jgi:peptidyl-prolyl cis-trans isomerase D